MEELLKRLSKLNDLIKALKPLKPNGPTLPTIPNIKPPPSPTMSPSNAKVPKISNGAGPDSKKDPKKVAEQIKNGSMSTKTQKVMLKADQWSSEELDKADEATKLKLYHIHQGPHQITTKPLTIPQINKQHGGTQKLESNGFRLIPHNGQIKEESTEKAEKPINPKDPVLNYDKLGPKAQSSEKQKELHQKIETHIKNKAKK
jgi:hypothetical protein